MRRPRMPVLLLWLVLLTSIGARVNIELPAYQPPAGAGASGKGFVFDETYYANAARLIAGVQVPAGDTYHMASPLGTDPNGEHPQLGKLVIAAGIKLFGDNGVGWRIGAVVLGTLALLALWWLVRAAGGSRWLALAAVSLMAFDNLMLVHSRIAVLDIYCLPFMLAGVALWLEGRPVRSGIAIALGLAFKLFAAYAILAIVLIEVIRAVAYLYDRGRRPDPATPLGARPTLVVQADTARQVGLRWLRVLLCTATAAGGFLLVLGVMDHAVPAYHDGHTVSAGGTVARIPFLSNPLDHVRFMWDYGSTLRFSDGHPKGIASYPWQFWVDIEPATYFSANVTVTSGSSVVSVDHPVNFIGMINPVLLALALPAFAFCAWYAVRRRDTMSIVVVAWYLATWLPAEVAWVTDSRMEYLYYMVTTVPLICVAAARLLSHPVIPRFLVGVWTGGFLTAFAILYPFRTLNLL